MRTGLDLGPAFAARYAATRRFTLGCPRDFRISPDETQVLYLRSPSGTDPCHYLYTLDLATGAASTIFAPDDRNEQEAQPAIADPISRLDERRRIQYTGVTTYSVDRHFRAAVAGVAGQVYRIDLKDRTPHRLPIHFPALDPEISPCGSYVSYLHADALWLYDYERGRDRILAGPERADPQIFYGAAEFVAAEEMGRDRGYWWDPEGRSVLTARVDQRAVATRRRPNCDTPARNLALERYPTPGKPNARTTLQLAHLDGYTVDVQWDRESYPYLVRAHWQSGHPPLIAVQSRDQRDVLFLSIDVASGRTTTVHRQQDPCWVHLFPGTPAWSDAGEVVRIEPVGDRYALLVGTRVITGPDIGVRAVQHCGATILFTASNRADPTQIHAFAATGDDVVPLTTRPGVHTVVQRGSTRVLSTQLLRAAPHHVVQSPRFGEIVVPTVPLEPPLIPAPLLVTAGRNALRSALLLPGEHQDGTPLPVLLDPYGGPSAQRVLHSRNAYLESQWFADQGFAVLIIDGRSTPGRGPAADRLLAGGFLDIEVQDQVDGLLAVAAEHPDLDLRRVAIRGWSHGGYLAACATARRPDIFRAAIVGAAVSDWRYYDTYFTERYLGDPRRHDAEYRKNSLVDIAASLTNPILLLHGIDDDNVHVEHTSTLAHAMRSAQLHPDVLLLPGVTHLPPTDPATAETLLSTQVRWLRKVLADPVRPSPPPAAGAAMPR
ncbi:prolyl oligopeptidase family serine peptidase [Nocardia brasiliensis]